MKNSDIKERRKHVRAPVSVDVTFSVIPRAEYDSARALSDENRLSIPQKNDGRASCLTGDSVSTGCDPYLIDLLLRIDSKLDRILDLVSKDEDDDKKIRKGKIRNISGAGMMSIFYEEKLQRGEILKTNFRISKIPPVWLELFGEIVRVVPITEGEKESYEIGMAFIDLRKEDRERIISYTFQQQREAIRQMKETE